MSDPTKSPENTEVKPEGQVSVDDLEPTNDPKGGATISANKLKVQPMTMPIPDAVEIPAPRLPGAGGNLPPSRM